MSSKVFGGPIDVAILILRLGFGLVFIAAGYRHAIINPSGYLTLFTGVGVPSPDLMAPFVAWLELLGGVAVLLGLLTRVAGGLLAVVMAVAIFASRLPAILAPKEGVEPPHIMSVIGGVQAEICLLVLGLFFLLMGAGKFALDASIFRKQS